jgi:hypothetical protein
MLSIFWLIFNNTFLAFFLIPLSSGSYFKIGIAFMGGVIPLAANVSAITLALLVNFALGRSVRWLFKNKPFKEYSNKILLLLLFTFLPVISGIIAFYFGLLRVKLFKFLPIIFLVNAIYYGASLSFPSLIIFLG